ncbi:MAG TPA: universal stress protein [Nitrospirota bacterium]|nr:universal stress protein [Nitrospirota bacterium]
MEKVLIAVDDTQGSRATITALRNMIRKPRTVILVTVQRLEGDSLVIDMLGEAEMKTLRESLKDTEHQEALDRRARNILDTYAWELWQEGITVKKMVRDGPPAEEILKVALEERVDLIIIGYSCKNFFTRLIKGSVSREIRKNGLVPFLIAKNGTCQEQSTGRGARGWVKGRAWQPAQTKRLFY